MEEKEMESWQKLIRVLAHEVSNSVTPITTLGTNIRKRLKTLIKDPESEVQIPSPVIEDIYRSTELIEQRGNGLINFIGQYKSFLRLPEPDIKPLTIKTLLDDVCSLCSHSVMKKSISLTNKVTPLNLQLKADRKMLEQILINVIQNALNALSGSSNGLINIEAHKEKNGMVILNIADNGPGITANIIDRVFVPFFTTEKQGNGIGLSLSRKIMQLHGGTIRLRSVEGKGTTVILTFPEG